MEKRSILALLIGLSIYGIVNLILIPFFKPYTYDCVKEISWMEFDELIDENQKVVLDHIVDSVEYNIYMTAKIYQCHDYKDTIFRATHYDADSLEVITEVYTEEQTPMLALNKLLDKFNADSILIAKSQ